jgi:hypothetical protein
MLIQIHAEDQRQKLPPRVGCQVQVRAPAESQNPLSALVIGEQARVEHPFEEAPIRDHFRGTRRVSTLGASGMEAANDRGELCKCIWPNFSHRRSKIDKSKRRVNRIAPVHGDVVSIAS